jgi:hypothetical protein
MQTIREESQHPQSSLAVVFARVLDRHRRFPIEVRYQFERQAALLAVAGVLGRIERDSQTISLQQKIEIVKNIRCSRKSSLAGVKVTRHLSNRRSFFGDLVLKAQ